MNSTENSYHAHKTAKLLARRQADQPIGCVSVRGDARRVTIERTDRKFQASHDPPQRQEGDIKGFSPSARKRMVDVLACVPKDAGGIFITLTYHETDPEGEQVKKHLHAVTEWMRRRYRAVQWAMVWRLEYQKRGVPHLHLLLFGPRWDSMDAIKSAWHRISGEQTGHHREMGAWVESMQGAGRKLAVYLAKYMTKAGENPDGWQGRAWGIRNRKHLPEAPVSMVIWIPYDLAYALTAQMVEGWEGDYPPPRRLSMWDEHPLEWVKQHIPPEYLNASP